MQLINSRLRYFIWAAVAVSTIFMGCSSCNSQKTKSDNESNLQSEYYKNIQSNVNGYKKQGFN